MMRFCVVLIAILCSSLTLAQPVAYQFAILDEERLFSESAAGRKTLVLFREEQVKITTEAEFLQRSLEAEEQALSDLRADLEPEEFRKLAKEFDEKTNRLREEQLAKNRAINQNFERARLDFFTAIAPILRDMFEELGVILVVNPSVVRYAVQDIDLTQRAIERIDKIITTKVEQGFKNDE